MNALDDARLEAGCAVHVSEPGVATVDAPDAIAWCPLTKLCGPCRDRREEEGGAR